MTAPVESLMLREARAAPTAVHNFFAVSGQAIDRLAVELRESSIRTVLTVARGSSDHAASHFGYLLLTQMGVLTMSVPTSAITLYNAPIDAAGMAAFAFSQSGQSPDLVAAMKALGLRGAQTAAFVNDIASPLALNVTHAIDLAAGPEVSVAATKSFIAQLAAGLRMIAAWSGEQRLLRALTELPDALASACIADWTDGVAMLVDASHLFVIARGPSLAIASEMALKFKEVCGIQAEAFSAAEVRHGPMALIDTGFPVLVLAPRGPGQAEAIAFACDMQSRGARVLLAASGKQAGAQLEICSSMHEALDGVCAIQSFYGMVEALARARRLDPDKPPHLSKVTRTQ